MNRYLIVTGDRQYELDGDGVDFDKHGNVSRLYIKEGEVKKGIAWFDGRPTVIKMNTPKNELLERLEEKTKEVSKLTRQIADAKLMIGETKRFRFRRLKRDLKQVFDGDVFACGSYGGGYQLIMKAFGIWNP